MTDIVANTSRIFAQWGDQLRTIDTDARETLYQRVSSQNPWFTSQSIGHALSGVIGWLHEDSLEQWLSSYEIEPRSAKTIGLIMAGNLPLVGFHDLLCTLAAGHKALIKLSSKDGVLLPYLLESLQHVSPVMAEKVLFTDRLSGFDAVIATGSDNSARYFDYYFGKYPNIIRKNRTSLAILTGEESDDELVALGKDVFTYFGLGCRNVSKLFVPPDYDFKRLLSLWERYQPIIDHHKYRNNYDYQLAIHLVNSIEHLDTGFLLVVKSEKLVSPISVLYYEYYEGVLAERLASVRDKTQCIVGNTVECNVRFGDAQRPGLSDYADHVDTMKFLLNL